MVKPSIQRRRFRFSQTPGSESRWRRWTSRKSWSSKRESPTSSSRRRSHCASKVPPIGRRISTSTSTAAGNSLSDPALSRYLIRHRTRRPIRPPAPPGAGALGRDRADPDADHHDPCGPPGDWQRPLQAEATEDRGRVARIFGSRFPGGCRPALRGVVPAWARALPPATRQGLGPGGLHLLRGDERARGQRLSHLGWAFRASRLPCPPPGLTLSELVPAVRAELRAALDLHAAGVAAPLLLGRGAALGAELGIAGLGSAGAAGGGGLLADVPPLQPVHRLRPLERLQLRRLGLRRGDLLVEVGGAPLAELRFLVEADGAADPVTAARALLELRPDLLHGLAQRRVVRRPAHRPLDLVGAVRHPAEDAAEEVAGDLGGRCGHPQLRRLEARHVAVATLLAVELELIPAVGGEILVISGELDVRHAL